ncbi:glycoside hydrolase family 55 protein [Acinetobacter baumannii]|uniref:glycoside hydrolase family 55 protein n=1 Tax=Acinetobacter baumannii TaxID=470 RepID=UPI001CB6E7FE|nr:glycoside hydrolase family 55 protein [Acinetobacter baumannii]
MAVPEQTPFIEYTANGATTVFPLTFDCDKSEYLIVSLDGEEAPVGSWALTNGSVAFNTAPSNGVLITIERNTPFRRTTEYQSYNNSFRPAPVNKDFDLIWWKLQELGYRDQVIWLALVKEIADRIAGDTNLQNQINTIDDWLENLQQNVNENTSDIAQLVTDLSKEIADRIANDEALKEMFLAMMDEAINDGTINALAITHLDSLEALEGVTNVWDGRTIYVKDLGNYRYDALTTSWVKAYQDADNVKYGSTNQKQVNDELLGDNGAGAVNLSFSEIANSVKKSLYEFVHDQIIDVTWFGAKGDWNMTTQTGTDDTQAIQNAINYYATIGSRRKGGVGAIKFPAGNYRYSTLKFPAIMSFGISFIGDGRLNTHLWADHTNTSPAFDSEIEFVEFQDLTLMGALSDSIGYTSAKATGYKGKLVNNYSDIDVSFKDCGIFCWNEFSSIYGRGFVVDTCTIGMTQTLLNVVCSTETVFLNNSPHSQKTGMRHYTIRNSRFDNVGALIKVTGTAAQKDHINDILITGNDMLYVDRIIQADDATVKRSLVMGNNALMSFAGGVARGKSFEGVSIVHNNFAKDFDDTVIPSSASQAIELIVLSTGASKNLNVSHNNVKYLKSTPVNVGSGSKNVKVLHNQFDSAWEPNYGTTSGTKYIVYSSGDIDGLEVDGNQFSSNGATGSFKVFNDAVQTSRNTKIGTNFAPWRWSDIRLSYIPKLLVNGVQSATAATATHGRYHVDDKYVYVEAMISINPAETSGDLAISLPAIVAVAENTAISSSYAGGGSVNRYVGFTVAQNMSSILVNPSNQQAELWKASNMTQSRLTAADKSGSIALYASFKYKY